MPRPALRRTLAWLALLGALQASAAEAESDRRPRPGRAGADPGRPLGRAASLRGQRRRPVLRPGLQRRPRPAVPDRPVAPARAGAARGRLRPRARRAGPRGAALPLPRRHGARVAQLRPRRAAHRRAASPPASMPTSTSSAATRRSCRSSSALRLCAGEVAGRGRGAHPQPRPGAQPRVGDLARRSSPCHSDLQVRRRFASACRRAGKPKIPDGLDPCIPPEAMRAYTLATQGVVLPARDGPAKRRAGGGDVRRRRTRGRVGRQQRLGGGAGQVAPPAGRSSPATRTAATRRPRCATSSTSTRPASASSAAASRRCRASRSATTARIAFGLTIFGIDQEDLYVYETRSAGGPTSTATAAAGRRCRRLSESIAVRGQRAGDGGAALHAPRPGDPTPSAAATAPTPCARAGSSRERRPTSAASTTCTRATSAEFRRAMAKLGRAGREPALCRRRRQHRLGRRRPGAGATQLGRPAAGARRRPLRVGRLLAGRPAAVGRSTRRPAGSPRRTS